MTRIDGRLIVFVAMLAGGGVLLGGQTPQTPPDQQSPLPTFRAAVEAVQLSVIVTDADGKPVTGLTAADFEIFENRAPRDITTFSAVDIPIERAERALADPDVLGNDRPPGRLYVIAFDAITPVNALRARVFLRQFIENYFGPNDTAAVVLTTRGPRDSGQDFTSNPRLLLNAIDRFGGDQPDGWDSTMRERNFIGDFRNLMAFMATLPGARKAMIYVTESIPVDAYDVVDARPARFGGLFSDVDPNWVEALSFATRNNIAIYPIDPRGLMGGGGTADAPDGENGLTTGFLDVGTDAGIDELDDRASMGGLGTVTGGFALTSSNNYDYAFERMVRENSSYYVLAFNSGAPRDGRYVPIEVRVKRPGLQVRTMEGYVAPRGRPQEPRRPRTVLAAVWDAVASAVTTSGVSMRVSAAPFRNRDGGKNATVAITLEIAPDKLNLVEQDGAYRGVLEILFATTDVKNKKWPIWRHRAALALKPETYERVSHGAIRVLSQLSLPEGRYQIRSSAGGAALAGSVVYDVVVPDFRDDFSLSGIAVTSSQASETFTFTPHKKLEMSFPAPPTTAREFSRDDKLTLFAEAYENRKKPHTVTLTIELHDEAGQVLDSHVMERKSADKPKQASVYTFSPYLDLEVVPPGRYAIRVVARSTLDRNKTVSRDVPFSVR
ncbi:MAG TPA: VWA domain-containing protein [Vicinamibacterales bacterium]|nr:VWA domain-containing protein [Vicinamibacterales bacterium]